MYPVADAFLEAVNSNTRKYRRTETITTTVGKTYEFENKDIVQDSGYITRECCASISKKIEARSKILLLVISARF